MSDWVDVEGVDSFAAFAAGVDEIGFAEDVDVFHDAEAGEFGKFFDESSGCFWAIAKFIEDASSGAVCECFPCCVEVFSHFFLVLFY